MDENEDFEGMHALFGTVVAATTPAFGLTPDDVAAAARARLRRRRATAALGGAASVTAVAIAITATMLAGGPRGKSTPAQPGQVTATRATPTPLADANGRAQQSGSQLFLALMASLQTSLDPQHSHLHWATASSVSSMRDGDNRLNGLTYGALWDAEIAKADPGSTQPRVYLQMDVDSATAHTQMARYGFLTQDGKALPWQHEESKKLGDGSTVTWALEQLPVGTSMVVNRVYPDGRQITIAVNDASESPNATAKPYQPFPFTTAALLAAISGPGLKVPDFSS